MNPEFWASSWQLLTIGLIGGYLCGAVPFGLILTKMAGLGDVRNIGSGNIGATNVLRTGNKGLAALTLILDALKGTFAVVLAKNFGADIAVVAGFGAFLGHLFPLWLKFKGGKGVATYIGILLGLSPFLVAIFAIVWLSCAYLFRYSSLAALAALCATPIGFLIFDTNENAILMTCLSLLSIFKHRENIARLRAGEESKIGKA